VKTLLASTLILATSCFSVEERCTTVEEIAAYPVCQIEGGPRIVLWRTFPLRLHTKDPRLSQRVAEASTRWNDDTALEIFTFDPACSTCPIIEIKEASTRSDALVATSSPIHDPGECDYYRGEILLFSGFRALDDTQQVDALQHELGHVLGLPDDAAGERTIMTQAGVELGCATSIAHIEYVTEQYGIALERARQPQLTRSPDFTSASDFLRSGN
jgi:hypothetical protein